MARIMGIDYGTKRTGIAVTDPLQLIASGLDTVPTEAIFDFLTGYMAAEEVERIVVGLPLYPDGNPAQIAPQVEQFVKKLQKLFPMLAVNTWDERYTSEEAKRIILQSGARKKQRRDKSLVDKVSAVLILEDYLKTHIWQSFS
ncbi:MAG: Holliday junction resolvase RuvX [Saprospirales bacterium]|nr:Holliday junction resolvase RuvX [Saprospirales bacterium]MBK8491122.1 Holliday junction resolvase RuvX [Saprospirales bacterium]